MNTADSQAIAECINTGAEDPETSRALVIFNLTPMPQSGVAVFRAAMSWPRDLPLPPVAITDSDGIPAPSDVREMTESADAKGRADRVQIGFALYFAVAYVPANGWRTYIASYTDSNGPRLENEGTNADLIVIETTRHGGDLPLTGRFGLGPIRRLPGV